MIYNCIILSKGKTCTKTGKEEDEEDEEDGTGEAAQSGILQIWGIKNAPVEKSFPHSSCKYVANM